MNIRMAYVNHTRTDVESQADVYLCDGRGGVIYGEKQEDIC